VRGVNLILTPSFLQVDELFDKDYPKRLIESSVPYAQYKLTLPSDI